MKCQQCSSPLGTPSKNPETKRKVARRNVPVKVKKEEGPDTTISWVVAFAAFMINFIMAGLSRMSGILYVEFIAMFKIDRKGASMPFSVRSSTMNLLGPVVGILGQKYGVRRVSVIGGLLGVFSSAACFFADDITWLTIMWGGVNGAGTALSTTLTTVIMAQYFDVYKTTAAGISFSGACIGSFIFPPLIEKLIAVYGLGGSFLIVAGIILNVLPAAMILHKPSWVKKANKLKDIESAKEKLQNSKPAPSIKNDQNIVDGVDLNYLRTNGDLVVKLLTKDIVSAEASKRSVFPPKDDILREMEDVYTYVGKPPSSTPTSEGPAKINVKLECETPPTNGKRSFRMERTSVGDYKHSPIRKTKSDDSPTSSQCKPFVMSRLQELYSKSENQIISADEKMVYTKALKELRKLHKLYEAVKSRNIYERVNGTPVNKSPSVKASKVKPKDLNTKPEKAGSNGIWDNIKNSVKLHTNPLFLLIALCRAVHFSTFIPVVTIIVDYTMDKGLLEEDGKYIIATLSVGDLLGRLCLGWVTDRGFISLPRYMMSVMVIQGLFTALLPMVNTKITLLPVICMYALLQGSVFVRHSVLISKYMKPGEQSIASGCVNFLAGLLGFAVPSYVGFFRDTMGSYDCIFYLNGAIGALTGVLWIFEPFFVKIASDLPDNESEQKTQQKV